jgi:glycosyltransferase involved in cell wall biosynthesis
MGGAEMSLLDMLASMRDAKPDWTLGLITGGDGPLTSNASRLGVLTTVLPFPPIFARLGDSSIIKGPIGVKQGRVKIFAKTLLACPSVLSYLKKLRYSIKIFAPDVIHTNGFKMHILGIWARRQSTPVIWHIRDYVQIRPVMAKLLKWHVARCSAIIANSKSVAEDVHTICENTVPVHTIYNAIDLNRFSPNGPALDLDSLSGLPTAETGTVKVGLLATLAKWKGHEIFLRALSILPKDLKVRGYIIGGALYQTEGSQHSLDELRALTAQLGLSKKVGFTDFVENPAAAIRALDIVVHASIRPEPFGRVIVEAMACGRAVIASEAGGAAEIVSSGKGVLGHPLGDIEAMAGLIMQLVSDKALRSRLGKFGRATVVNHFNQTRLANELLKIYTSRAIKEI